MFTIGILSPSLVFIQSLAPTLPEPDVLLNLLQWAVLYDLSKTSVPSKIDESSTFILKYNPAGCDSLLSKKSSGWDWISITLYCLSTFVATPS